jgi:hypothetical protein
VPAPRATEHVGAASVVIHEFRLATMVSLTAYIAVATVLVSGTVAAIASKVAYQLKVAGQDGDQHKCALAQLQQFPHALRARARSVLNSRYRITFLVFLLVNLADSPRRICSQD